MGYFIPQVKGHFINHASTNSEINGESIILIKVEELFHLVFVWFGFHYLILKIYTVTIQNSR